MTEKLHKRKKVWIQENPEVDYRYHRFVARRKILATSHSSEERDLMYIVDWQQNNKTL